MGSYSEQERQAIKEQVIISYDDAIAIYGYQVQHFIDASKKGLTIYYEDGKTIDRPLEEFATDYMKEEVDYLSNSIGYNNHESEIDRIDFINAIARRMVKPVDCFLEICSFRQKQLIDIMDKVLSAKRVGRKVQTEGREETGKYFITYSETIDGKMPGKFKVSREIQHRMTKDGKGQMFVQQEVFDRLKSKRKSLAS